MKSDKASPIEGGKFTGNCFGYVAGKETFSAVGFEAVKHVLMKIRIFWDLTTCRLVISCRRFGGEDCHHLVFYNNSNNNNNNNNIFNCKWAVARWQWL
jgi:hypothetical protein